MQTLYALEAQDSPKTGDAQKILKKHFDQSRQLLIYLIFFLTELARYAETDSLRRSAKHLPSEGDMNVNTKLAGNQLLWKMLEQESYRNIIKKDKPELIDHADMDGPLLLEEDLATGIEYDHGKIIYSNEPGLGINYTGLFQKSTTEAK